MLGIVLYNIKIIFTIIHVIYIYYYNELKAVLIIQKSEYRNNNF